MNIIKLSVNKFLFFLISILICIILIITKHNYISLVLLGFLIEEILHSFFICLFSKNKIINIKITLFYILPILFSLIIPDNLSKKQKIIIIILPPIIVLITASMLSIFKYINIYQLLFLSLVSIFSMIPINFGGIKTDMHYCILLNKNHE